MEMDFDSIDAPNILSLSKARKEYGRCRHIKVIIDEENSTVECKDCGEKLNPIWVLSRYATEETKLKREIDYLRRMRKALEDKHRTKCKHCGKMTDVNVKVSW